MKKGIEKSGIGITGNGLSQEEVIKDILPEKISQQSPGQLFQDQKLFRALVEHNDAIISLMDENLHVIYRSASATRITGWAHGEFEKLEFGGFVHPEDWESVNTILAASLKEPGTTRPLQARILHKNGHYIWLEGSVTNRLPDPDIRCIVVNLKDVTERRESEQKTLKANRLYFFISQVNQMIVRTKDEETLYREACQIAVATGKFRMAWIGLTDEEKKVVIPVMHAGEGQNYLSIITSISIEDVPEGRGPTGTALREDRYIVCNDIEKDPKMAPWKEAATEHGYLASMALPIKKFGKVIGAFSLYASEKNYFDTDEISLLQEVTGDISYALENMEKEKLRKSMEEQLRRNEEKYHILVEHASDSIFMADPDLRYVEVNDRACALTGYSKEELYKLNIQDLVELKDDHIPFRFEELKAGKSIIQQRKFKRKNGVVVPVEISARMLPDGRLLAIVRDITERIEAAQKLVSEKELSDKIINSLPGLFYLSDPTPRLLRWNKSFEEISGYTAEELGRIVPITLFDPDDQPIVKRSLEKTYREGNADVEARLLTRNGKKILFYFTGVRIEYEGKPAILGTGIDISDQRKAEEEIKKANERFELIEKASNDALWEWNLVTHELWGNEAHQKLYGLTLADPVPTDDEWKKRLHPDDLEKMNMIVREALDSQSNSFDAEYRLFTENKGWIHVYGITYIDRDKQGKPVRMVGSMMDITQRVKAEEAIKASEQKYRTLVEQASDAIFITDVNGRITTVNSSACKLSQFTEMELMQKTIYDFAIVEDLEREPFRFEDLKSGKSVITERLMKIKDGTIINIEVSAKLLQDGRFLVFIRDITERKKAEEEIRRSDERYRNLVNNLSAGIVVHAPDTSILYNNPMASELLGLTQDQMKGKTAIDPDWEFLTENNDPIPVEEYPVNQVIRSKHLIKNVVLGINRPLTHDIVWVIVNGFPVINDKGELTEIVISFVDITERKETREILRKSEEKYRQIVETAQEGIWMIDEKNLTTFVNPRMASMMGYEVEEMTGKHLFHFMDEEGKEISRQNIERRQMGIVEQHEFRFLKKNGENIFTLIETNPIMEGDVYKGSLAMMMDITERKKAEMALMNAEKRLQFLLSSTPAVIYSGQAEPPYAATFISENITEQTGYLSSDFIHDPRFWLDNIHPDDRKRVMEDLFHLHEKGMHVHEYRFRLKNGSYVWMHDEARLVSDSGGKTQELVGYWINVDERKKAELAIQASEERYRSLVEQASDAILITDKNGNIITANNSASRLSGYTMEEIQQMTIYDFALFEDLEVNPFHFKELQQGKTVITERTMKGKKGKQLHVEVNAKMLADKRILIFARDISERKKVQDEIIKEKNLSDSIINSLPGIFYLVSPELKFLRWNRNFEEVSGYASSEIIQMHPLDFFDIEEKGLIAEKIENVFKAGEDNVLASFLLKSKKKVPFYFTGKAIEYEGATCLVGVGIDFSERVEAQQMIRETTDQLRQLTGHLQNIREQERKRIGREIHDELGQQLTAIKMDVAWIEKKLPDENAPIKTKLKNVIKLLDNGNKSIRRILNELRPVILDEFGLYEALKWHGGQFFENTGIEVDFFTPETLQKVPEEMATCIFRVFQEALTNITRYAKAKKVSISLNITNEFADLVIQDDGVGFDAEKIKSKMTFGLLGMRERVKALDGDFFLESHPGKGTKISVHIPRKKWHP